MADQPPPGDPTRPSFGRMYDFVLGGTHNYPVDRAAVAEVIKVFPPYPEWARLNRAFLQVAAFRWSAQGIHHVLDLASGLPTQGHFHDTMPGAKVVYNDNDPGIVADAQAMLGAAPHVTYVEGDIRDLPPILAAATAFLGAPPRIGIGCIGIAYVLDDETLRRMAAELAAWARPGSSLAVTALWIQPNSPTKAAMAAVAQRSAQMPTFFRTTAEIEELMRPWTLEEVKPVEEWLGVAHTIVAAERVGADFQINGAFFRR